ncbi:hypothetical protein EHP00_1691 [Ecytonucleospora hepatopenaei]|uniref:Uncharacterized protein n=1 Tax=Ecytonucleospora hepatopenaei TaxID=646526 RepID=A0A1W0E559_9MICR|nr:hypothetical protein EHP00_1691 [Ecytonucleospora hepatopenaei]
MIYLSSFLLSFLKLCAKNVIEVDFLEKEKTLTTEEKKEALLQIQSYLNKAEKDKKENKDKQDKNMFKSNYDINTKNVSSRMPFENNKIYVKNKENSTFETSVFEENKEKSRKIEKEHTKQLDFYIDQIYRYVPITFDLYNYYLNNVKEKFESNTDSNKIKKFKKSKNKRLNSLTIKDVLIYKREDRFFDFYNKIEFYKKPEGFFDKFDNIKAYNKIFKSHSDLSKKGFLSENGFYVLKNSKYVRDNSNVLRKIISRNYLISELKSFKSTDDEDNKNSENFQKNDINVLKLCNENAVKDALKKIFSKFTFVSLQHSIIQYELSTNRPDDKIPVCICKSEKCNEKCEEVRKAYRRDIYDFLL